MTSIRNKIKLPVVYTDFDGTITKKDLGDGLFKIHGKFQPFNSQLLSGQMTIHEYWRTLCANLNDYVDRDVIKQFALSMEVDPYFKTFAVFCRQNDIPLTVISDGFEEYIKPILENEGLGWIPVRCNRMIFNDDGLIEPYYPLASESCSCLAASCKRNAILLDSSPDSVIVYIGDGFSDFCGASHSDIIFAKKTLAAFCNENRIPHYPFSNFFDVYRIFQQVMNKGSLKTRHQAMLLRKKAFEIE